MSVRILYVPIALSVAAGAAAAPFHSLARTKDGDSLMVGQTEVRLFGIDAPEIDQSCKRGTQTWACGSEAADRLARLVTGKEVRCTSMGTDQHNRILARCSVGMTDINRTMVATGYAVAYRRYSSDYVSAEETAKANRRGIWAGTFELPSAYRHHDRPITSKSGARQRSPVVVRAQPTGSCNIKGNQGTNGWIYHVPGMPYYAKTRAEQLFCSEAEARSAGYRRAKIR